MNKQEAILNKLIELGVVIQNGGHYKHADGSFISMKRFNAIDNAHDAELIKQALFDECAKRECEIRIRDNELQIYDWLLKDSLIHEGDTSRESFLAAFKKVTGCE